MKTDCVIKEYEKVYKKIDLLNKKRKLMGLDKNESEKLCKLSAQYIQLRVKLYDEMFEDMVFMYLIHDEAERLSKRIYNKCNWNIELLIYEEEINKVEESYNKCNNKKELIDDIYSLYIELIKNLDDYLIEIDKECIDEIVYILGHEGEIAKETFKTYIDYRFEVLYMILDIWEEIDEKVKESIE